jgi:hypothetical protein
MRTSEVVGIVCKEVVAYGGSRSFTQRIGSGCGIPDEK